MDLENLNLQEMLDEIEKNIKKPNILICGAKNSGKSSVINYIFSNELANIGAGEYIEEGIKRYSDKKTPLIVYDTTGYSFEESLQKDFSRNLNSFLNTNSFLDLDEQIHLIWYCISAENKFLSYSDVSFLEELLQWNLPIAILFTKVDLAEKQYFLKFIEDFEGHFPNLMHFNVARLDLVDSSNGRFEDLLQWEALVDWSLDNLNESLKKGAVISLSRHLERKKDMVLKDVIPKYVAAAATAGVIPIPIADSAILIPIQVKMSMDIMEVFGIDHMKNLLRNLIGSTLISSLGKQAASMLRNAALKFIPFAGSLVGGVVNASVASSFTYGIGRTVCEICYRYNCALLEDSDVKIESFFNQKEFQDIYMSIVKNLNKK